MAQTNVRSRDTREAPVDRESSSPQDMSLRDASMSDRSTEQASFLQEFRAAFRRMYREGDSADFQRLQSDPRMIKAQGLDLAHLAPPKTTTPQE